MENLLSLVPVEKRDAVTEAINSTFEGAPLDSASLLSGGLSSALVYRLGIGGQGYVLRLVMQRDGLRDPAREYVCLNLASQAKIAPAVHYTHAEAGISISDFITADPFSTGLLLPLAETIKSIHALPLFPPLVGFLDGVDMFIGNFRASGILPAHLTEEHFHYYARIQEIYPRHDPNLVSSHNDLNPGNLLFDGEKIWIIDWESAFSNDRYVDLAIAATFFMPEPDVEESFLRVYFGDDLNQYHRDRFFLMRQVCQVYYATVFFSLAASQITPAYVVDQSMETPTPREFQAMVRAGETSRATLDGQILCGKVMLNEALRQMKLPRFENALRTIQRNNL